MTPARAPVPADVLRTFPGTPSAPLPMERLRAVRFQREMGEAAVGAVVRFLASGFQELEALGLHDVVVGLSGGLDSVVVTRLCQLAAAGVREVRAVFVDLGRPTDAPLRAAVGACAHKLGVPCDTIDGRDLRRAIHAAHPPVGPWSAINTDTRLIQDLIFRVADARRASVVATADLSEKLLGRHTEAFYGQLEPLGRLYKSEVRELATTLGVADLLGDARAGCADYWYDDEVLGAPYEAIDPLLHLMSTERRSPAWIAVHYAIADEAWVARLALRVQTQALRTSTRSASVPPSDTSGRWPAEG